MKNMKRLATLCVLATAVAGAASAENDLKIKITKKYLNFPIGNQDKRGSMKILENGVATQWFDIKIADKKADYWVFCDVSRYKGKEITLRYNLEDKGLGMIYQSDEIAGQDSMYHETNRPQVHFTTRRGWNNDPNGLLYHDGEYHLFYQYNPYEAGWGNMHWGHAVSRDLLHWEELNIALYPDKLGAMFSGSAVMDYENTSGFGQKGKPAMVAIYTAAAPDRQTQCIAYSLDKGRTWTKYEKNPVIDSKEKWNSGSTRDPKVFWYAPGKHWVMVLFERDGHSIYNSKNLKDWTYKSHVTGFWECPELFELPVDGNENHKKWVMYGATGTYMIGSFDGQKFTPEAGKYQYCAGDIYAAQTITNIPKEDGRRIQIGWGRISHPGMPFMSMMLFPTKLSLKTTKDGVRLYNEPVEELSKLQTMVLKKENLNTKEAAELLKPYAEATSLRIRTTMKLTHAYGMGFALAGQPLINYDTNFNKINGTFYSPNDMTSMEITADIILDKTSVEVFIDGGALFYCMPRTAKKGSKKEFSFWGGDPLEIKSLEVYTLDSIWK